MENNKFKYIQEPLKERLKKNSISNVLFFILTFPLMFIITPMILKYVGKELYGVWALTGTILLFIELFAGVQTSSALAIIIPKYEPEKQSNDINEYVNTLFVFYFLTAVFFIFIYFLTQDKFINLFFKVNSELIPLTKFIVAFSICLFLLNFILTSFAYLLGAFNIFYIYNILHIIIGYIRFIFMIFVLIKGYGIKGIVIVQMISILIETLILFICAKKIFPPLRFNPKLFKIEKLKTLLNFSIKFFITKMSVLVNNNADKLILGFLTSPIIVAYYQIGANLSKYIYNLPETLGLISLLPATAELKEKKQLIKVKFLYDRVNKYIFFIGIFLLSGLIIFGKEFIFLWLGKGYEKVYIVVIFLSTAYFLSLFGYSPMHFLNGIGKVHIPMRISLFVATINIILSIILTIKFGLLGALTGTGISIMCGSIFLYYEFSKEFKHKMNIKDIFFKPVFTIFLLFVIIYLLKNLNYTWLYFLLKIFIFTFLYFSLNIFVLKHFDEYDFNLIKTLLKK